MTRFDERMELASSHESAVLARLISLGWDAFPFGQGLLIEKNRNSLKKVRTNIRWCPDMVAIGGSMLISVDAKAGDAWRKTGNHDAEISAIRSLTAWSLYSGFPSYFVFSDFTCATPQMMDDRGFDGKFYGNGSGTPFRLIKVSDCLPFDDVFGCPLPLYEKEP